MALCPTETVSSAWRNFFRANKSPVKQIDKYFQDLRWN